MTGDTVLKLGRFGNRCRARALNENYQRLSRERNDRYRAAANALGMKCFGPTPVFTGFSFTWERWVKFAGPNAEDSTEVFPLATVYPETEIPREEEEQIYLGYIGGGDSSHLLKWAVEVMGFERTPPQSVFAFGGRNPGFHKRFAEKGGCTFVVATQTHTVQGNEKACYVYSRGSAVPHSNATYQVAGVHELTRLGNSNCLFAFRIPQSQLIT